MTPPTSIKTYVRVWIALMVLLFLSWGAAQVNLGPFNTVASVGIAALKMLLVILVFMHVRNRRSLVWLFVVGGFVWFFILVDLSLSDYLSRRVTGGWPKKAEQIPQL